jgi:hypothetical protein
MLDSYLLQQVTAARLMGLEHPEDATKLRLAKKRRPGLGVCPGVPLAGGAAAPWRGRMPEHTLAATTAVA